MNASNYFALLGVAVVLAVTPGPDTLLTLQYALRQQCAGVLAALGTTTGIFVWAGLVAAGVAAFLQDSPVTFHSLRALGGAYLFYLGFRAFASRHRAPAQTPSAPASVPVGARVAAPEGSGASGPTTPSNTPDEFDSSEPKPNPAARSPFLAGLLCCLTNPKTGLFFLALIPQFTPANAGALYVIVVVGGTVAAIIGAYLLLITMGARTASVWLNRPAVTRSIERISGAVFILLGLMTIIPVVSVVL